MFDDSSEPTQFEPMPLGARQRVIPRHNFKAVPSQITDLELIEEQDLVTACVPALPPTDHLFVTERVRPEPKAEMVTERVPRLPPPPIDERVVVTERVARLPPPARSARPPLPPHIVRTNVRLTAQVLTPPPPAMPVKPASRLARVLARFGLPIGGSLVVVLLALYLALPGHARGLTAAANQIAPLGAGSGETPTETFQLTSSDDQPPEELAVPEPAKPAHATKKRPRKIVAVDASTPLGNLRPGSSF